MRWRNGDELVGRLLDGPDGFVRLSAPSFAAPFDLDPAQLTGLRFPATTVPQEAAEEPLFEISLKNGDRLRGRLLAIDRERLLFHVSPFESPVPIRRGEVSRLVQTSPDKGLSGLGEIEDWTSTGRDRKPTDWFTDLRGELATHQWTANLFREIDLPERVELRFHARFPGGSPNLEIGLLRDPRRGPMLETWDEHLVLTHLTRFAPVLQFDEATRELHLRLFWDQRSGEILLCDPSGKLLASLEGKTEPPHPDPGRRASDPLRRGFSILSRNPEMKLVSLEVREWDGAPVPMVDPTRARLQLRDDPVRFGNDEVTLAEGSDRLRIGSGSHPLDELVEWVLSPDASAEASPPMESTTRVAWVSGTTLSGDYLRLGEKTIAIQPTWTDAPLVASLSGAREVRFPEATAPLASGADTLTLDGQVLRGTLRLSGDGGSLLAWQPPGARDGVSFSDGSSVSIVRGAFPDVAAEPPVRLGQTRLYLADDEILVGELIALDPETIVFQSRVTGRIEIPAKEVRAIDIGTPERLLEGFRDPEWESVGETAESVVLAPESATMHDGGFGNPSILLGDRIRFDAEWKESHGAMTLRLFASGPDPGNPSTDVVFAAQGNRLFIGKLNANGAFSFSGDQIPIVDNRAAIDIAARPEEVEIRINGKSSLTLQVDPDKVSGNGIYFKMGGGWQGLNQTKSAIVLSHFRIENSPGNIPRRVIDPRAKAQVLSIPRSMRERAPTHLLVAPNGDLLRGTLAAVGRDAVEFQANGETLSIPRSRVSSIVRLETPVAGPSLSAEPSTDPLSAEDVLSEAQEEEDAPSGEAPVDPFAEEHLRKLAAYDFRASHRLVLRDGTRLRLEGKNVEGARLVGRSPILGECLVALEQIREVARTSPLPLQDAPSMDFVAFRDWRPVLAPDPAIPDAGGPPASPLVGEDAPEFELSRLDDSTFRLGDHRGKVVVLDFWATWSGPCIKAMPEVLAAVAAFPPEAVAFVAVNQGETPPIVGEFLEGREWQDTPVALDFNLKVSQSYQVEDIPHTVVIDPEGRIAWVHSGFSPNLKQKLFEAIVKVLSRQ